ncbi:B3 domain-containing protein Os03g0212300 isoform X2 [Dendrobium catenatum]|uniref:B3 domain-containing protein Os03g0212300 isoform X2 n=1 Tax=Dendrobium catenatum TaxID=906689 RepID=UPI0009F50765|nr:B3 domain-containing protein Os03g0212300 isoform X2 [Dendrobium catenatum]
MLLLTTQMAKVAMKKKKVATRFFKVMLPGYLNELPIPPKFARNLSVQNHRAATIRDPLGRSWPANVEGKGEDLWFCGEGWMNFVKGLDIGIGYFLVFKYKGNMKFYVKVFDLTACEVEYSHEICYSKRFELSSTLNKQGEAKASKTAEKLIKQFCKSLGPHFSITLKFCNLRSRPYLNVPLGFLASYRFENKSKVILVDPKGRSSPVRITIRKRRPIIQCCFGMGWHEFCLRNHLSAGDKCIFEIKSEEADAYIVHVHIIRE